MEIKIFYSWQSDLPNSTNRGFIQKALERAAGSIRDDESIKVEPVIDRDTIGVPGSPDIAETILAKIDGCHIFVGDVSIVNPDSEKRKTPNPNVMLELGYALKKLSFNGIIMVLNSAFGGPEKLPFDLKMKRVIVYDMHENSTNKSDERKVLSKKLETQIRAMIDNIEKKENANSGKNLLPLEILLDHRILSSTQKRHDYQLDISILNKEDSIIKNYHADIRFPKIFLLHAEAGKPIKGRDNRDILFSRVDGRQWEGIYPGDKKLIARLKYYVDDNNHQKVFIDDNIVSITLYIEGFDEPVAIEKPFESIQNF